MTSRAAARRWDQRKCERRFEPLEPRLALAVWFVNDDATGTNSGISWPDAFSDLRDALTASAAGDEIWLASGVYRPATPAPTGPIPLADYQASFVLRDGVTLRGGFAGNETTPQERLATTAASYLSGMLRHDSWNPSPQVFHVVTVSAGTTAELDGLFVSGGNANLDAANRNGGGIVNQGTLTIRNAGVSGGKAHWGGGIYNEGEVTIINSVLAANKAVQCCGYNSFFNGGAIYNTGRLELDAVGFFDNDASGAGGAIYNAGTLHSRNAHFASNATEGFGGAVAQVGGTADIAQGMFNYNIATYGGAIYAEQELTLTASTVYLNGGYRGAGGGIYLNSAARATLSHSIVAENWNYYSPPEIADSRFFDLRAPAGTLLARYNLVGIGDGATGLASGVNGNIAGTANAPVNPKLLAVYPRYDLSSFPLANRESDYQVILPRRDSPAIDAGDPSFDPASLDPPLNQDWLGQPRVDDHNYDGVDRVDLGPIELISQRFVVSTTVDEIDADYSAGDLSLREAVLLADSRLGDDEIVLPAGEYRLSLIDENRPEESGYEDPTQRDLDLLDIIGVTSFIGAGRDTTTIDAGGIDRIVTARGAAEAEGLTFRRGRAEGSGGAIAGGSWTITDSRLLDNETANYGGAISGGDTSVVALVRSEVIDNRAGAGGGMAFSHGAQVVLIDSNVSENVATSVGGGVYFYFVDPVYGGFLTTCESSVGNNQELEEPAYFYESAGGIDRPCGDLDLDGNVDLTDLALLGSRFGATGARYIDGDLTGDGLVNRSDAAMFAKQFGIPPPYEDLPPADSPTAAATVIARRTTPRVTAERDANQMRQRNRAAAFDRAIADQSALTAERRRDGLGANKSPKERRATPGVRRANATHRLGDEA